MHSLKAPTPVLQVKSIWCEEHGCVLSQAPLYEKDGFSMSCEQLHRMAGERIGLDRRDELVFCTTPFSA